MLLSAPLCRAICDAYESVLYDAHSTAEVRMFSVGDVFERALFCTMYDSILAPLLIG